MAYLSKHSILSAYSQLSKLTSDPSAQGATQITSALRYIFALDEFTKKFGRECDTSNKEDRDLFISFVGNVVSVNKDFYTANFFNAIKDNQDYAVGSNFLSVNVVKNSVVNPSTEFPFPKRGNNPLFIVKAGRLIEKDELLLNLKEYLQTPELRNAFAVWLVRFSPISQDDIFGSILDNLKNRYTDKLIKELLIDKQLILQLVGNSLIDNPYSLSISDFPTLNTKKNLSVDILPPEELANKVRDCFTHFVHMVNTHTDDFTDYINVFESRLNPFIAKAGLGLDSVFQIVDIDQYNAIISKIVADNPEIEFITKARENNGWKYQVGSTHSYYQIYLTTIAEGDFRVNLAQQQTHKVAFATAVLNDKYANFLRAMRTKPFLLLAGISGTGKSRIVKQFAFKSCPDNAGLRKDPTSPGNYCLVEVKPNWHDSTELLGYESQIGGAHYVLTTFLKFVAKAMLNPDVPFFLCLDEMNLAPVEQYFAEFLSVLESRKLRDAHITSEPLVKADVFRKYESSLCTELFDLMADKPQNYNGTLTTSDIAARYGKESAVYDILKAEGMRIPENLIVIGTVNMDETTHQFSRKVIDRAMTIEMNIEDGKEPFDSFFEDYEELDYVDAPLPKDLFLPEYVNAAEALDKIASEHPDIVEKLKQSVPEKLAALNSALNGTPFKIAYRVQNELILYFYSLLVENPEGEFDNLLNTAIDNIMMMKVLPRVEGDEDTLKEPLKKLAEFTSNVYPQSAAKVKEMSDRLERAHFTSFWP